MTQDSRLTRYDWWLEIGVRETWAYKDNLFSAEEIDLINLQSPKSKPNLGKVGSDYGIEKLDYRNSTISNLESSNDENCWIFERITAAISSMNKEFWNFELNRIETLQYSVYNKGQFYKPHIDSLYITPDNSIRKLSFSVQLSDSDDYEGGDLMLHTSGNPVPTSRKKGTIVFFPSYTLHEVSEVTKGTRSALVGWVTGPSFR